MTDRLRQAEALFARCLGRSASEIDRLLDAPEVPATLASEVRELLAAAEGDTLAAMTPARVDPSTELEGRMIGGYRVLGLIGVGGMGSVHLAEDPALRRRVAIKTLRSDSATSEMLARFAAESATLARLQHPGIATIHDADVDLVDEKPLPWLAMEHLDGATPIDAYCTQHDLAGQARIGLFRQVLEAAHHAHVRGVIHRDLKPSNILVTPDGVTKLIDFGVARSLDDADRGVRTTEGAVIGTPRYMSPEQCRGDSASADTRSDIFSAAVVLYELLTGRHPFNIDGKAPLEAMRVIADGRAASARTTTASISRDLEAVLAKALESDPEDRYQSAAEFGDDLGRVLDGEPVEARRLSISRLIRSRARRHPGLAVAAVMTLLVTIAAVVYGSIMTTRVYQAGLRGQRYIDTLLQILQHDAIKDGGADATLADALEAMSIATTRLDRPEDRSNRADMQMVLAAAWDHLGMHDRAVEAARDATELRALALGEDSPVTLEARLVLMQLESEGTLRALAAGESEAPTNAGDAFIKLVEEHRSRLGDDDPQTQAAMLALARSLVLQLPEREPEARELREVLGEDAGIQIAYAALSTAWDEYEAAGAGITPEQLLGLVDRMESAERVATGIRPEPLLLLGVHTMMLSSRPILRDDPAHMERVLSAVDRYDALCDATRSSDRVLDPNYLPGWENASLATFQSNALDRRLQTLLDLNRSEEVLEVWEARQSELLPGDAWGWGTRWAAYAAARLGRTEKERELLEAIIEHARVQSPPLEDLIESCLKRLRKLDEDLTAESSQPATQPSSTESSVN